MRRRSALPGTAGSPCPRPPGSAWPSSAVTTAIARCRGGRQRSGTLVRRLEALWESAGGSGYGLTGRRDRLAESSGAVRHLPTTLTGTTDRGYFPISSLRGAVDLRRARRMPAPPSRSP